METCVYRRHGDAIPGATGERFAAIRADDLAAIHSSSHRPQRRRDWEPVDVVVDAAHTGLAGKTIATSPAPLVAGPPKKSGQSR